MGDLDDEPRPDHLWHPVRIDPTHGSCPPWQSQVLNGEKKGLRVVAFAPVTAFNSP